MPITCSNCGYRCEERDAFCRRCGAPFTYQVSDNPEPDHSPGSGSPRVLVGEVMDIQPAASPVRDLALGAGKQLTSLSKIAGGKMIEALKSEQGKKLAKGAATVAVAVGMELAAQAARQLAKNNANPAQPRSLEARPPANPAEALLKALEDRIAPAKKSPEPEDEDTVYEEQIFIRRRIIRRGE